MPKLNQEGIAHFAVLLVLLAGITVGSIVVQQRTNFLPKAQCEEDCEEPEEEAQEDETTADPEQEPESEETPEPTPEGEEELQNPWEEFVEGAQKFVDNFAQSTEEGLLELGNNLGLVSDERYEEVVVENKIEDVVEEYNDPPTVSELLEDPEIPDEERREAIRVFAEASGIDPNDEEAVNQLLMDSRILAADTDPVLATYQPVSSSLYGRTFLKGLVTPLRESYAEDDIRDVFGENLENHEEIKQLVILGIAYGVTPEILRSNAYEPAQNLINYIADNLYVSSGINGVSFKGIGNSAPPDIVASWNALRYYGGDNLPMYITGTKEEVIQKITPIAYAALTAQTSSSSFTEKNTENTRNTIKSLVDYASSNNPFDQQVDLDAWYEINRSQISANKAIVLDDPSAFKAFEGRVMNSEDKLRFAAWFNPKDESIVIREGFVDRPEIYTHEWIHFLASKTNATHQGPLRYGSAFDLNFVTNFDEGLTETVNILGSHVTSTDHGISYAPIVKAIREEIVPIMINNGYTQDEAYSTIVTAALMGNYSPMLNAVESTKGSPFNDFPILGLNQVKGIINNATRGTKFGLLDILIGSVHAENMNEEDIRYGVANSPYATNFDKWNSLGMTIYNLPSVRSGGGNDQGVIISLNDRQLVVNFDSLSFDLASRKNLVSNFIRSDNELGKEATQDLISTEILEPYISVNSDGYILFTGKVGVIKSKIKKGKYKVSINPFEGYDVKIPSQINTQNKSKAIISIAVTEGTGKVAYIQPKTNSLASNLFTVSANEGESEVEMVVFDDKNGNGRLDRTENLLPWAGVTVSLEDTNTESPTSSPTPASSNIPINNEPVPFYKIHVPQ